ncbi:MAG: adenosylmethionine decarboxylase [Thermoprotei archaeon]|nr:MAG: adenosylmethionine decarboxylase [Thermoprotei archaeon]
MKRGVGLGRHVVAELYDCDPRALDDVKVVETALIEAARATNSAIINYYVHRFKPYGVSGYVLIAESHISIHTWPEYGYAAVDVFTCGEHTDPWRGLEVLRRFLRARHISIIAMVRGVGVKEVYSECREAAKEVT